MNLPIYENDRMHCIAIPDSPTKYFLGTLCVSAASAEDDTVINIKKDRSKDYHSITTTVQRQRETYLGRIGLKSFRLGIERCRNLPNCRY